jgi:cation:H+ antiporter
MAPAIWPSLIAVAGGFALLVWGADRLVYGASASARNLGVSPMVIGLTIVGFGTSTPEMVVSATAALQGNPGLADGNAIGSNIANIGLILGCTAIVQPLVVKSETLRREYPLMFAAMLFTVMLMFDLSLSRVDGLMLLAGLVGLTVLIVRLGLRQNNRDPMAAEYKVEVPSHVSMGFSLFWLGLGLGVLLISSRILVWGAVNIAHALGVSDFVIGLTIVAIGTSMPEMATSVMSAVKKEHDIALGNILGSNMFNLLAVLGLSAAISPHRLEPLILRRDMVAMFLFSIALFVMGFGFRADGRVNRWEGVLLLFGYLSYLFILSRDIL